MTPKEFAKSDLEYARYEDYSREDHTDKDRFMFECRQSNWEETRKGLGESIYIVWMSFGIVIEKINESVDNLEIFISVPKSSYRNDVHGNEMAGDILAKRFQDKMRGIGVKRLTVRYRVRDEYWTEQMYKDAEIKARQMIYGSQW